MTWQDRPMRAEWDETLDAFTADAGAPGSGSDEAEGPAGPAGVSVLRTGGASVSQCTMTGRVSSLWFEASPSDEERALVGLVLPPGAEHRLDVPRESGPLDLPIAPVADRIEVARLAILTDTEKNVPIPEGSMADVLLRAEQAAVLKALHETNPDFVAAEEVRAARERADSLAEASNGALPAGVRFDPDPVSQLLLPIAAKLTEGSAEGEESPAVKLLLDTAHDLKNERLDMGAEAAAPVPVEELPRFRGVPVAVPELFGQPPLTVIGNPGDLEDGRVTLPSVPIGPDGSISLGALAAKQFGFSAGRMEQDGAWTTMRFPMERGARHPENHWAIGLRGDQPVGSGPFTIVGDEAIAQFASKEQPDQIIVGGSPLIRSSASALADLASLDRLSRAAWWRHRTRPGEAAEWFAHCSVRWLTMGRVFRAGWAWSLADKKTAAKLLAARAEGPNLTAAIATLEAVVASGDLPAAAMTDRIPVPAWVHAIDLTDYARFDPRWG